MPKTTKTRKKGTGVELKKRIMALFPDKEQDISEKNLKMDEDDLDFVKKVLPAGMQDCASWYYKSGNKYVASVIVTGYTSYMDDLTLANLFNELPGTIVMDISKKNKVKQVQEVEGSLNELVARGEITSKVGDTLNDKYSFEDLSALHGALQRGSEEVVYATQRFYLYGDSPEELEEMVTGIQEKLDILSMKHVVPENETFGEYRALQNPADTIHQPIPVYDTLCRQFPFWHQTHKDDNGIFFGLTPTGGLVLLDTFYVDDDRKSFDILITGLKGAGKSATIKSMAQDYAALGHKVLMIDVEGELVKIAEKIGATVISPGYDDKNNNPLQLRQMFSAEFENDDGSEITERQRLADRRTNYVAELARVEQFIRQYKPDLLSEDLDELKEITEATYQEKGISELTHLGSLAPTRFPLFSDLIHNVRTKLYVNFEQGDLTYRSGLTPKKREILERLESCLKPLAEGRFASIFNQHSNINIENDNVVIFDISKISEMGEEVYNAFMFDTLSMIWGEIYKNREQNSYIENEDDRKYCIAVIDEAHKIVNTKSKHGLEFIEKLVRRSRKYDSALWFASQSIRDFVSSGESENIEKLRSIFEMVQYKMLMQQDESSIPIVISLFPQFTESEIASTTSFKKGEMLLSMGATHKIRCKKYIPKSDFAYFKGGR